MKAWRKPCVCASLLHGCRLVTTLNTPPYGAVFDSDQGFPTVSSAAVHNC